jgi:hypothetical protein
VGCGLMGMIDRCLFCQVGRLGRGIECYLLFRITENSLA